MPQIPPLYLQILQKLAISIIIACLAVVVSRVAARLLRKRVKDGSEMQTLGVLVRKITYITAVVIILVVVFELGSNFGTVLGIPQSPAWPCLAGGDRFLCRLPEHNHREHIQDRRQDTDRQCRR